MDRHRLEWLFKKYFDKTISSDEQNELMRYIETASSEELTSLMENVFNFQINARTSDFFTEGQRGKMLERILSGKRQEDASLELSVLRLRKAKERKKLKLSAVAAVFLLSFTFAALLYKNYSGPAVSVLAESSVAADIPPGGDRATLTLADGSVISLNEIAGGKIADQGGVTVTKTADGLLMYTLTNVLDAQLVEERAIPVYNTITTPRGGQYQVVLPDGTKVWLNAESSLRYPALFSKTERRVELMGEGYFEVAKNDKAFFIVETDAQSVRVLGTHFNIN
ncbi:MAG TPA: FecR family protein, partial [Sphingobacterium sp.]|nr:FecR family protein [Sphingobacterium sp.]